MMNDMCGINYYALSGLLWNMDFISEGRCPSLIDHAPSGLSHYSPERA